MRILAVALLIGLAIPASGAAQIFIKYGGVDGEVNAQVIAPRNYLEQIRSGTLSELELALPAGALNDAIARASTGSRRLDALTARVPEPTAGYLEIRMTNAMISHYSVASDGDKLGRVKVQFQLDPPGAAGKLEIGVLKAGSSEVVSAVGVSGDGLADVVAGTGPYQARLATPGALQSLRGGGAGSGPIAIEVPRGSPLERILRGSFAEKRVIPALQLGLSEAGAERTGRTTPATLTNVRVVGSKRGNTVATDVITLTYEEMKIDW